MGALDGRVAVITGAGRGIGREHALLFAREGARVVVNDLGGAADGGGADAGPAHEVVEEIRAFGGEAVAHTESVSSWEGGQSVIKAALDAFGDLHVLVNNAGILRDRMLVNMSEEEWDAVVNVHLKGHFVPTKFAAVYWREQAKAGVDVKASVIGTSSTSGLFGNAGQTNYGAAKMGIAALMIITQMELGRYGVRCNAIAPAAMTRLIQTIPGIEDRVSREAQDFDRMDPANISPFVAYLATEDCPIQGKVFYVAGGEVALFEPFTLVDRIRKDGRWTVDELREQAARFADVEFDYGRTPVEP
ncbi:MAG TPA: SDR family oxidoreductase [Acidimicrobiia bacterium]|nr:SDR family oxidoreductase [Acidimicrobiia bacterium]